jgi:Protein of unknown function (DUF2721)
MFPALQIIQTFVAPVVVISANGLLCLALYNRLAAVISRTRTINKERFDLFARLSSMVDREDRAAEATHLKRRLHVLDELGHQLFRRGRMIRDALILLLVAVECMIACSLSLGLGPLWPFFDGVALMFFIVGMVVMIAGIFKAIQELWIALEPVRYEHDMMEHLQREHVAAPK